MRQSPTVPLLVLLLLSGAAAADGNRLAYLDEFCDPYYVGLHAAKLITPQWVGEPGVEAVIVLSVDDLREPAVHERFLRPILNRLKQIDGRAPVSLQANRLDPAHPQLQQWLKEGLSIEAHTLDRPCPLLRGGNLAVAKATYDAGVDLVSRIPNCRPVAFRMPCCDSMTSLSPRFFTEIFNKTTPQGNFVRIDSSVFHFFTPGDAALPRELVLEPGGREKFRKYVPRGRGMVNTIEDYPYPYVIAGLCWELPSAVPSDWEGHNLNGPCSVNTVRDLKAAIDATVLKQGVFVFCFHPHGWIRNDQVVELIDHAVGKYGKKIRFLNFAEVQQRLDRNLLVGHPLRGANGQPNGVLVLDVNNDGYMDVVLGNRRVRQTRLWSPQTGRWSDTSFPLPLVDVDSTGGPPVAGVHFGVLRPDGLPTILACNEQTAAAWHLDAAKQAWVQDPAALRGLDAETISAVQKEPRAMRLYDIDGDGTCELLVGYPNKQGVFRWAADRRTWARLPFMLPEGAVLVDARGRDAGLRLVDLNGDGRADVVFSNAERYGVYLFTSLSNGWSRKVVSARRAQSDELPMIVRADGTNNGAWFSYRHLWVQNEDTGDKLPNHLLGRSFSQILPAESGFLFNKRPRRRK